MHLKQSVQRAWQHFWWHPITGPVVPMGAFIGLAMSASYAFGLTTGAGNPASFNDVDCKDFATRAEAQAFFEAQGADDPYWLDFDGDGRACELYTR
jgi:hypothetical protein